jgi:hypothetical protein
VIRTRNADEMTPGHHGQARRSVRIGCGFIYVAEINRPAVVKVEPLTDGCTRTVDAG